MRGEAWAKLPCMDAFPTRRLLIAGLLLLPAQVLAQPSASTGATLSTHVSERDRSGHAARGVLPFAVGEVLQFRVNVARGGNIGTGEMRVESTSAQEPAPWRFVSEMKARRGFLTATDRSTSWFDPSHMASARFDKRERHPLSRADERIDIDRLAGRWRSTRDSVGEPLGSDSPLDELSFLYFVRTLPLDRDSTFQFNRHYDERRNPTLVSVGAEELLETEAGTFRTRVVVMHVRDPKHFKGIGLIKLNIDLSPCRMPVRIVSKMPIVGTTTLTLTQHRSAAVRNCTAVSDST